MFIDKKKFYLFFKVTDQGQSLSNQKKQNWYILSELLYSIKYQLPNNHIAVIIILKSQHPTQKVAESNRLNLANISRQSCIILKFT